MATAKKRKAPVPSMTLADLLVLKLQALYDIENTLVKALPKMAKNATDAELKQGFTDHLEETKNHVTRLEQAFKILDEKPKALKCEAIRGLVADAEWVMKNVKGSAALDANLIAAARYVEHYEMAGYMSAQSWATLLDATEVADLLGDTLAEEQNADETLETLAASRINDEAAVGPDTEDEEEA